MVSLSQSVGDGDADGEEDGDGEEEGLDDTDELIDDDGEEEREDDTEELGEGDDDGEEETDAEGDGEEEGELAHTEGTSVAKATEPLLVRVLPLPDASVRTLSSDHSPCIFVVAVPNTLHIFAAIVETERCAFQTRTRLTLPSRGRETASPKRPI